MEQARRSRPSFTCNGRAVVVARAGRRVAAARAAGAARHLLGQGRLRAARAVRVLHGARRRRAARRVRHADRACRRRASVTTIEGLDPSTRDRHRRPRSSRPADRSAGSARRASSCGRRAGASAISIARWPRTCAGAPAGAPCTTRSRSRTPAARAPSARDLDAAARRGGVGRRRRRRTSAPTFRSAARTSPTTPRRATRSSRCRSRRARRPTRSTRPGCAGWSADVVGRRREPRRARCRAGARRSRSEPPLVRRARRPVPPAACGSRRRGSSPRTSSPTRRGASPAVSRRRRYVNGGAFGGKLRLGRAGRGARARGPARRDRARRVLARRRRAARARSVRRSRRPRCGTTARSRSTAWSRAAAARRSHATWPTPYACAVVGALARGRRRRVRRSASTLRAAGLAEQARARRRRARRGRRRPRVAHRDADACSTRACWRRRVRARARACIIDPTTGALERIEVRVAAGDPLDEIVLRSYVIGAAHMALGWVCTESLVGRPGHRRGARPHDPVVRHPARRRTCRRSTSTWSTTTASRSPDASDAVFAAVAAAAWNALARAEGTRPDTFPPVRRVPRADSGGRRCPSIPSPPRARRRWPGPYSPAVRAGDWLVLAGQVGLDPATGDDRRRRRRGPGPPGARQHRGGARRLRRVAHRRRQDHRVRHRHRRVRDGQRGLRRGLRRPPPRPLDRAGRRPPRRRPGRDRSLGLPPASAPASDADRFAP